MKIIVKPLSDVMNTTADEVRKKADIIGKALNSGKDVELRKTKDGISVTELTKKRI